MWSGMWIGRHLIFLCVDPCLPHGEQKTELWGNILPCLSGYFCTSKLKECWALLLLLFDCTGTRWCQLVPSYTMPGPKGPMLLTGPCHPIWTGPFGKDQCAAWMKWASSRDKRNLTICMWTVPWHFLLVPEVNPEVNPGSFANLVTTTVSFLCSQAQEQVFPFSGSSASPLKWEKAIEIQRCFVSSAHLSHVADLWGEKMSLNINRSINMSLHMHSIHTLSI